MTILDSHLPYALVDLVLDISYALWAGILMCLSAGYFAATLPAVVLSIWGIETAPNVTLPELTV